MQRRPDVVLFGAGMVAGVHAAACQSLDWPIRAVASRNAERALDLAGRVGARACSFDDVVAERLRERSGHATHAADPESGIEEDLLRGAEREQADVRAIEDAVADIEGVTYVAVRENDTAAVDPEGLPPHSFRVTVLGGDEQTIAETIYRKKAAGIKTHGNESRFVEDGEGLLKAIFFQRPLLKYIWIGIVITPGEKYPQVGDPEAAIAAAVALWGDTNISISDDVERFAFGTPINVVPGVKGATVTLGFTLNALDPQPVLVAADLVMASTDLALFDSSRVLVTA